MTAIFSTFVFGLYNVMMYLNLITKEQVKEVVINVCIDYIYRDIEETLLWIHKKYPDDKDLKRDVMINILTKKIFVMERFIKNAVWNKAFSEKIFKEMEKLVIRKISWKLGCDGFQLFLTETR